MWQCDNVECKSELLLCTVEYIPWFKLFLLCFICTSYSYFDSDALPVGSTPTKYAYQDRSQPIGWSSLVFLERLNCAVWHLRYLKYLLLGSKTMLNGFSFPQCDLSERICEWIIHFSSNFWGLWNQSGSDLCAGMCLTFAIKSWNQPPSSPVIWQ